MHDAAQPRRPTLVPLIRYRDPEAAVAWLTDALGFATRRRATGADGTFAYAHLTFGESLVMVTRHHKADCARKPKLPAMGQVAGQRCYFVVGDIDAHFVRAKDAGADIVHAIADYEHGGRRYACRDLEGHIWTFGTYDPWQATLPVPVTPQPTGIASPTPFARRSAVIAAGLTLLAASALVWQIAQPQRPPDESDKVAAATARNTDDDAARLELQRARTALAAAQAARAAALSEQSNVRAELAQERAAREAAERSAEELAAELAAARATRLAAEQMSRKLQEHQKTDAESAQAVADLSASVPADLAASTPTEPAGSVQLAASPVPAPIPLPPPHSSNPALAEAHAALARGDVEAARHLLRGLADLGNAEAALALGSTYDPVNIARSGLANAEADRAQAKRWYRRALELAQSARERQEEP